MYVYLSFVLFLFWEPNVFQTLLGGGVGWANLVLFVEGLGFEFLLKLLKFPWKKWVNYLRLFFIIQSLKFAVCSSFEMTL